MDVRCRVCGKPMLETDEAGRLFIPGGFSLPPGGVPSLAHVECERCDLCGEPMAWTQPDGPLTKASTIGHVACQVRRTGEIVRAAMAQPRT